MAINSGSMRFLLGRPQRQWLAVFLLASLLLPIVIAFMLVAIGQASGCQMTGSTAQICLVQGVNIGEVIKMLVDWTWFMPAMITFEIPLLTVGLFVGLVLLVYKSFQGWTRVLVGFLSIWHFYFAPIVAGIIFVLYVSGQAQCSLNEGGVGSCYVFGLDMGSTFHTAASIPWLLIILFPPCITISVIYVVVALVNRNHRSPQ